MSPGLRLPFHQSTSFTTELVSATAAKYLGVTISDDLSWGTHVNNISKNANQTLGFLKWNIKIHKQDLKSTAYKTLVRPQLEYASTVWSPHTAIDIQKIESVQRRVARWATRDYRYTSSVTSLLKNQPRRPLDQRRIDCRLVMLYKVTYDLGCTQSQPPIISHQTVGSPDPFFGKQTDTHTQELL